jgi:hypothetical protein
MRAKRNAYKILENPKGDTQLGRQGVHGRIMLKLVFKDTGCESRDGTQVVQDRDQWQVLVNTVMELWVP